MLHAGVNTLPVSCCTEYQQIRIGISSCLLGEKVRFDGGHKRDAFIADILGKNFTWLPVCPEIEIGLGAPRETLRLEGTPDNPRLIAPSSHNDLTESMLHYAGNRVRDLLELNLHGYILKKNSPSCGLERVRVYNPKGSPLPNGRGLFAKALIDHCPLLPVVEEVHLQDMRWRENFIERVFAYHRWQEMRAKQLATADVIRFHLQHKLTLMAHSRRHYQALGRLTAQAGNMDLKDLLDVYGETFMAALAVKATPKKHANVLYHLLGYLKKSIDTADKEEVVMLIEAYRNEQLPLVAPLTMLQHHFRRHPVPWVAEQTYLHPHPAELMLRHHV